jgi:hypothetical protein
MTGLNVFELTNKELHNSTDSKQTAKKSVKESVSKKSAKAPKKVTPFSIPASKLKLESLRTFLEADEDEDIVVDATTDYTPEDDVVVVIDPDAEDVPEDVDDAVDAAEELVGQHVCKCAICGANYVTDTEINEEVEIEDQECPVCGETGDQIVVGVITPTEELSDEDSDDVDGVEEEEDITVDDEDGDVDFDEEEDEEFEEAVKRSRMRTMRRRAESVRRTSSKRAPKNESVESDFSFDEVTLNRMLTRFAKENYSNVKSVKISKGTVRGSKLTLEGVVTTTKGSKRSIKFVSENFKPASRMSIKFKEYGPFTESIQNDGATFVVECVMKSDKIIPAALKYSYKAKNAGMRESRNTYSVTGKVLSESARTRRK